MINSPVDFDVSVSNNYFSLGVYVGHDILVPPKICRQDHRWCKSEYYGTKLLVCSMTLLSFFLLLAADEYGWIESSLFHHGTALQSFRSKATCSKVPYGMLTAARLLLSLSLYLGHGPPTFLCPLSSWLYIRTLGLYRSFLGLFRS